MSPAFIKVLSEDQFGVEAHAGCRYQSGKVGDYIMLAEPTVHGRGDSAIAL